MGMRGGKVVLRGTCEVGFAGQRSGDGESTIGRTISFPGGLGRTRMLYSCFF